MACTTGDAPDGTPPATLLSWNRSVSQMFALPGAGYAALGAGSPARPGSAGSSSQYHWFGLEPFLVGGGVCADDVLLVPDPVPEWLPPEPVVEVEPPVRDPVLEAPPPAS